MKKAIKLLLAIVTLPIYFVFFMIIGVVLGLIQGLELTEEAFNSISTVQ